MDVKPATSLRKEPPPITSYLIEEERAILKTFEKGLYGVFNEDQKLALVAGYASGLSDEISAMKDAAELCRYWNRKQWTEQEMEDFQVMTLMMPGMDGIAVAFEYHPMYRRLMNASDTSDTNLSSYVEDINATKIMPREAENDNNVVSSRFSLDPKPRVTFVESDDEAPLLLDDAPTGYRLHRILVAGEEMLKQLYIPPKARGVCCVYRTALKMGGQTLMIQEFDLLRGFKMFANCVVEITCMTKQNKTSAVWKKYVDVKKGLLYNFAEQLIPNDSDRCQILISQVGAEGVEHEIEIMGMILTREERTKNIVRLIKDEFDPFTYGFHPVFKLEGTIDV